MQSRSAKNGKHAWALLLLRVMVGWVFVSEGIQNRTASQNRPARVSY